MSKQTIFIALTSIFLAACSSDDNGGSTATSTTFQGAIAFSSGEDGSISITVPDETARLSVRAQSSDGQAITGNCVFSGGQQALEGSLQSDGAFELTGGDYTFTGTFDFDTGTFTGTLTKNGDAAGSFSGVEGEDAPRVFCGTFEDPGDDQGAFIVVVSGTTITGSYSGTKSSGGLTGTLDGDSFTVNSSTEVGSASGTISGNSIVDGIIYNENHEARGTFTGNTDNCSV